MALSSVESLVIATQMPCLKLNEHSINPDNDVAIRLSGSDRTIRLATKEPQGLSNSGHGEQFGSTCERHQLRHVHAVSPLAQMADGALNTFSRHSIAPCPHKLRAKRSRWF